MKQVLFLLGLVLFVVGVSYGQTFPVLYRVASTSIIDNAYANSDTDTSGTITGLGQFPFVTLYLSSTDSIDITGIYLDTRTQGNTTFSVYDSAKTIQLTSNTANYYAWDLNTTAVNKIKGLGTQVRFRVVFNSSGNGVTSPVYSIRLRYK